MAQDSRPPAVTLSVVEDEVAAEGLVPVLLADVAGVARPPRTPSPDGSRTRRRSR